MVAVTGNGAAIIIYCMIFNSVISISAELTKRLSLAKGKIRMSKLLTLR